jgi:hypothetical protein
MKNFCGRAYASRNYCGLEMIVLLQKESPCPQTKWTPVLTEAAICEIVPTYEV